MGSIRTRTSKNGVKHYDAEVAKKGYLRMSRTFTRLTEARAWIQDVESDMRNKRQHQKVEECRYTLKEAIDRYIEQELKRTHHPYAEHQISQLEWFKDRIGHMYLSQVTPARLSECKAYFLTENIGKLKERIRSSSTWNRYQAALSCVFQKCSGEWQLMADNPARKIKREKEPRGRMRILTDEERKRFLDECQKVRSRNLYPMAVLALSTGMRRGEIRYLTWNDVDLKNGVIILNETKNGERRRVALRGLALELLREHAKVRRLDSDYIFPGPRTNKTGKPYQPIEAFRAAVKRAEIEDFRFHDLRHCCASYLAMNGASLIEIAEVLGHKTLAMVKRYSHLAESHTAGVVERMNEKIFG